MTAILGSAFGSWKWPLLSLLCAAGIWTYANRVLIPYQVSDAAAHGRPRGNLSDLYPRWLGARELLLHGRDPYSAEVAREIQAGYYGHPLDAARPGDPRDQQGFAYPVYVVFFLAPTVRLPFEIVRPVFFWMLALLTAASALVWLRVLGWPTSFATQFTVVVLTLGSLAVMQGLKLEQMSLLVSGLVTIAVLLLIKDHAVPSGIVLALATVKPQLVVFLLLWLALWTLADLRRRYVWCASFLVTMAILFAASEWYLPHWIARFWQALGEYQTYTGSMGVMEKLIGTIAGRTLGVLAFAMMLMVCWRQRRAAANSVAFAYTVSMVLAITVLLAPTYAVYNQVLLIPALQGLAGERSTLWRQDLATRLLFVVTVVFVLWPWIASVALAGLTHIFPPESVERGWAVPFWTTLLIPVGVAAVMLIRAGQRTFAASAETRTS